MRNALPEFAHFRIQLLQLSRVMPAAGGPRRRCRAAAAPRHTSCVKDTLARTSPTGLAWSGSLSRTVSSPSTNQPSNPLWRSAATISAISTFPAPDGRSVHALGDRFGGAPTRAPVAGGAASTGAGSAGDAVQHARLVPAPQRAASARGVLAELAGVLRIRTPQK